MAADGDPGGFFTTDGDLVLQNKLADVLEADGGFIEGNLVMLGDGVDEVGGGDGFGDAVAPAAGFDKVIEEQGDDVVGLNEGAIAIRYAEAVGVAVCGDDERCADFLGFFLCVPEEMIIRLGGVAAEEDVAEVVDGFDGNAGFTEDVGGVAPACAPEGIVDDLDAGFGDGFEVDEFGETLDE